MLVGRKLRQSFTWGVVGLLAVPTISFGHSLYIQSRRYGVSTGKSSPLFFGFGHHFPVDDALRSKKLSYIHVTDPEQAVVDIEIREEKSLHSYLVNYQKPGTYVLTAETNPGYFAMYTDLKNRKRHSLKPMSTFIVNAKSVESSMRSSQWAKTWVVSGEASQDFPAVSGLPLEIVPTEDITAAKEGDSAVFMIYKNGQRYMGEGLWDATYAGFSTESEDLFFPSREIEDGLFTVPLAHSGRWFIRFYTKIPAEQKDREKFLTLKQTATITFLVRNERKRPKAD